MTPASFRTAALLVVVSCSGVKEGAHSAPARDEILVAPGEAIQAALDRAPEGGTVRLGEGTWSERIVITKPVTLVGAGWEKSRISVQELGSARMTDTMLGQLRDNATTGEERRKISEEWVNRVARPAVLVRNCSDVSLRDLRVQGASDRGPEGGIGYETLVCFQRASGTISGCAVVGPYGQGVQVVDESDVEITGSLVAAIWGTGISASGRDPDRDAGPSRLRLLGSEIRNCHHRCVELGTTDARIERCRISGSAWHGIRYDQCGPTIVENAIFGNARSGLYASGRTSAIVRGNVFWKNEMDGVSCWFENADTIEGNTFVGNLREGLMVVEGGRPTVSRNVFAGNPVAIDCSITRDKNRPGDPRIGENVFWENPTILNRLNEVQPTPASSLLLDPQFRDAEKLDFALVAGSPAHSAGMGAHDPVAPAAQWPIQEEERAIVPTSDTRDSRQWRAAVAQAAPKRD